MDIFECHNVARKKLRTELDLFMQGERNVERYREAGITWWDYCGSILVDSYPTYFEKLPPLIAKINREKRNSKNYVLFLGSTDAESNQAPCLSLVPGLMIRYEMYGRLSGVFLDPLAGVDEDFDPRRYLIFRPRRLAGVVTPAPRPYGAFQVRYHGQMASIRRANRRGVVVAAVRIDKGEQVLSAYQRSSDANLGLPTDIYHLYLMSRQVEAPLKSITLNLANVHTYANNIENTRRLLAGDEDVKFGLNV